jgi:endonuclease/exonuclease/phosphatase family metal-dependent hydrolase
MGDLNMEDGTEGIRVLADNFQDAKTVAKKVIQTQAGTFNGFKVDEPAVARIDYIFLSKDIKIVNRYEVLIEKPNGRYPSDHFPVIVNFELPRK